MNKILVLILIFLFCISVYAQDDGLNVKKITSESQDSLLTLPNEVKADSIAKTDSVHIIQDSLKALQQKVLISIVEKGIISTYEFGNTLNHKRILFSDYRFIGDLINQSSTGFIRDFGMLGQPDEILVYGAGYNNISYLQDGMSLNNRFTNSLDLNFLQSESIDSIEIIPTVRGFLYGSAMNPVSINFISKNNFTIDGKKGAYSRLRYYQAANEEAFIDATFKTNITSRLISIFEMTNESITDRFRNSNYDAWKGNVKLNYLISDNFNLIGNYNYLKSEVHLFGGINLDSLSKSTLQLTSDLYYPVINYSRYEKNTSHNIYLKLVNNITTKNSGLLSAYYRFNLLEYRQNEHGTIENEELISRNHITKVLGGLFREDYEDSLFSTNLIANYEKVFVKNDSGFKDTQASFASISGKLTFKLLGNKFIPSLFGKFLYSNNQSFYGFGGDVTYHFSPCMSFYTGISYFQKPSNIFGNYIMGESSYEKIVNIEAGLNFKYKLISLSTNIFHRKINNYLMPSIDPIDKIIAAKELIGNLFGADFNLTIDFWNIYIESKNSFYYNEFSSNNYERNYLLPEYVVKGGVFYKDTLFNSNLNLKTGISVTAIGIQNLYSYNFETSTFLPWYSVSSQAQVQANGILSPSIVFNFLLIGEIQDRAIIYFTFENLFDKQYYIVPYYLKQGRGIRLGVSWEFLN